METQTIRLDARLLTAEDEIDLARRIEAGIYAQHVLSTDQRPEQRQALQQVVQRGLAAREKMWRHNLRLVNKLAIQSARYHQLPIDDLFQDGCLALHDAILRFDYRRGHRFSTLAYTYITRQLAHSAAARHHDVDGLETRRRHRARILQLRSEAHDHEPTLVALAAQAGISHSAAQRATSQHLPLEAVDDRRHHTPAYDVPDTEVDFLELMGADGILLKLRFGIGRPAVSLAEAAARFGTSITSIARRERRALRRARDILEADMCRYATSLPAAS